MRLDELLVRRGEFVTRSRARDAIERGAVRVDGQVAGKPGHSVSSGASIEIDDPARRYVSRAALKQFAPMLAGDPRVSLIEGLNARDLTAADLAGQVPGFIVCDVSFISLKLALPPALELAAPGARAVLLVKPQFEAGRAAIGKGGLLRDPETGARIAQELQGWLDAMPGWRTLGLCPSAIEGGDGNQEFLLAGVKDR
jgi:23S rRNA (cytidine1920-2'-O)/16S rRNA (cytidine1409-2'-O)-methyltransferase